ITIGGSTAQPLRPLSPRPTYNPSTASGFRGGSNPGNGSPVYGMPARPVNPGYGNNTTRSAPGYVPWANSPANRPNTWTPPVAPSGTYHPPATGGGYSGGGSVSRPSGGGGGGSPH